MKNFDRLEKELIDKWRQGAAMLSDSTREQIMSMSKSGKNGEEICLALGLASEHVSIILIEGFAKERGETPVFTVDGIYMAQGSDQL